MTSIPARVMAADQNDLKPSIRPGHSFDRTVVLLHDIVQVLYLAEFDAGFNVGVVHFYRRGVGATLDDGDLLRRTPLVDGFAEEAGSCFAVPLGSEKEVNSVSRFVDGSIPILPLALDAYVRLVHAPARAHEALALPEDLIEHGDVLAHPAIQTGMVNLNAALLHHFFKLPMAEGIRHIPTDAPKNDVPLEPAALEIYHRSLRCLSISWKDIQSRRNLKLCDRVQSAGIKPALLSRQPIVKCYVRHQKVQPPFFVATRLLQY
jgi:hypothetical protein